ncbi:MAG: efflux RND transporter periplasmic adaptor subunit [Alphaproteobacteria bacterium]|nr:efflux RND transporter periplasmic adaptor subunit [Alphaproteobacteria bacterium]MBU1513105.1 efflux RND transporter periplasmic adaptor subunit [Alphaproteobacteria bacterium]MBU2095213.1 efflux RND transporter periplasmic adaptor subunit [Alphaproteobacteria bacterium]MBU2150628.1 efflux RND transporter periplasmic adaptor subunit [Alphaproteobacteria bacterium]MBU2306113.1 efflux RND transporter periplasmic adaptor subunit [Alphaproteobacteria bacterium]
MSDLLPKQAAALLAALFLAGCGAEAQTPPPAPPIQEVSVAKVAFQTLRQWDDFTGRLEPVDSVSLRPRVAGQIVAAPFTEGARVAKGQLLFQIDARPFQAEVDRLRAQAEQAGARAQLAIGDSGRGQRLLAQDAIAGEEAERLASTAKAAQADLQAAQASLRSAELNLSFTRVTSPIDGRVSKAMITRGNLVTPTDILTTVVSDSPIYATFNADEQTYLKYAEAQRSGQEPVYMGLMDEAGFPHRGKLQFLDNAVDARSGTIVGRAIFDNADGSFTPGLFARVRLVSSAAQSVALVPERSLGTDLGKRYVLVLGEGDRVQYRPVTLGRAVGEQRIVLSGLKPGERIVTAGLQKVKPGDKVKPRLVAPPKTTTAELVSLQPAG